MATARTEHRDFVLTTVRDHAAALLKHARRHSLCADDAQDAYQRAIEVFLRRADSLDPEGVPGWLRTVVKHEALAVRRARMQLIGHEEVDLDLQEASSTPSPEERLVSFERTAQAAEALQRLKPQEVRALWLKAEGHSYEEICRITGWSYTKVNRCITEGRRSFLERYRGIEAGDECARWAPVLSALADGEASPEQLVEVRPHLRSCAGCRATVRAFHRAPREAAALLPIPALAAATAGGSGTGPLAGALAAARGLAGSVREAVTGLAGRMPGVAEPSAGAVLGGGGGLAAAGAKAAALCASVGVAAGGTLCLTSTGVLPEAKSEASVAASRPARPGPGPQSPADPATAALPDPARGMPSRSSSSRDVEGGRKDSPPERRAGEPSAPAAATEPSGSGEFEPEPVSSSPTSSQSSDPNPSPPPGDPGGEFGP